MVFQTRFYFKYFTHINTFHSESNPLKIKCQSLSHIQLLRPHGLQPTRFLCPWDSPGKNTGVSCHFPLQEIFPTKDSSRVSCMHTNSLPTEPPEKPQTVLFLIFQVMKLNHRENKRLCLGHTTADVNSGVVKFIHYAVIPFSFVPFL